jgi:hypothetical protein
VGIVMIPFFQGAASGAPAPGTVFATTLYTGNGSSRTITSGINTSTPGGLVWIKPRDSGPQNHTLFDTQRGAEARLTSNTTNVEDTVSGAVTAFGSTGFNLGTSTVTNANLVTHVAWSFARAARFFDVVTYTGDGTSNRQISHALGISPGMVVVKPRNNSGTGYDGWYVRHRSATGTLYLNLTNAQEGSFSTIPAVSASTFTVTGDCNENGETYVAYLWAHDTASDGIVQCGSYTGNGSATGPTVTLGWNPQFLLIKRADGGGADTWVMFDSARGLGSGNDPHLCPNNSGEEDGTFLPADFVSLTGTGFQIMRAGGEVNKIASTHVYLAIRA